MLNTLISKKTPAARVKIDIQFTNSFQWPCKNNIIIRRQYFNTKYH